MLIKKVELMRQDPATGVNRLTRSTLWVPTVVLVVTLLATVLLYRVVDRGITEHAEFRLRSQSDEITRRFLRRLRLNEQVLHGGNALFGVKGDSLTRDDWRQYVASLNLSEKLPGTLGVGYAVWLSPSQKEGHVRKVRAEGFPGYTIRPDGERSSYTAIIWLEPFNEKNRRAFGYDMYSEPVRRGAMERARDTGETSIAAGGITLVQESGKDMQRGMLMYAPSYRQGMATETVAQRRAALRGFVYSPIRLNDFISAIFTTLPSEIDFEINAGRTPSPDNLIFSSRHAHHRSLPEGYRPLFATSRTIDAYGVTWHFSFTSLPPFDAGINHGKVQTILLVGLPLSIVMGLLSFMQLRSRQQSLIIAEQVERQLAAQQRLFLLVQQTPLAVIEWDDRLRVIAWNRAAEEIFGYAADEAIGAHASFIVPESAVPDLSAVLASHRQSTGSTRRVGRNLTKDGAIIDCEWFTTGLVDQQGTVVGIVSLVQDISEQKQAEQELRRASTYARSLIEASLDPLVTIAPDGTISDVNRASTLATGSSREEMIGTDFSSYFTDPDRARAGYLQVFDKGAVRDYPLEIRHRDGRITPVLYNATVFRDEAGNVAGVFAAARDITEIKQYERQLEDARDTAEAANRAKSEFLANMSHEIRTPLNGVMGMIQLLEYTALTEIQRNYLDVMRSSSESLLSLINDVLDLSRIEAGRIELEMRDFSLRGSVSDVITTQISLIHRKGLGIETDIPAAVPDNLSGDQLRLKQILLNLLGNAIKFTNKGGIRIAVTVSERHSDTALLTIAVTDTGIGIGPEALRKIFEPFVQADSSTTRQYGGSGLGLSICTRLAELMGGRIWAESREGAGSTFFVQIPFTVNEAVVERHDRRRGDRRAPLTDLLPLRILLVDDQEINLFFATRILEMAGHTVVPARDGREALERWAEESFDAILMDIQMPVMNGIEATRIIREKEEGSGGRIPIIAVTARALREERETIGSQGFDGYVTKPLELELLQGELRRCLAQRTPQPVGPSSLPPAS